MGNSYYDVECRDEELQIYSVTKKKENRTYYLTRRMDGSWIHSCKVIEVKGEDYLCRHKKMVLAKFYVNDQFKHLYNITPTKKTALSTDTEDNTT